MQIGPFNKQLQSYSDEFLLEAYKETHDRKRWTGTEPEERKHWYELCNLRYELEPSLDNANYTEKDLCNEICRRWAEEHSHEYDHEYE